MQGCAHLRGNRRLVKSVLFVSIAFPPKFDSEGLQVAKYVKYLKTACQDRFALDVVTSSVPTLNMPYDDTLRGAATGFRQVIELPILENKYTNYLLRRLWPTLAWSPDSKFTFHWQWRRVVSNLEQSPDLIYSRSFPASSAIMARKLKRHYNVPWIMHLSDPWADSPHVDYSGGARELNQRLEHECFEGADVICLTSQKTIEYYQSKYPKFRDKFEFYPNVYDPEDIPETRISKSIPNKKVRFVHTGGLAGSRTPEPFLLAVSQLPIETRNKMEVVFAGHADRANREVLQRYSPDYVTYLGPLDTYQEALALQRTADILILIDFPVDNPDIRVYFLSKLLDYHITGKPILAITDKNSECQDFIESERGDAIDRHDVNEIRQCLLDIVEDRIPSNSEYLAPRPIRPEYSAMENAIRLRELFSKLSNS